MVLIKSMNYSGLTSPLKLGILNSVKNLILSFNNSPVRLRRSISKTRNSFTPQR